MSPIHVFPSLNSFLSLPQHRTFAEQGVAFPWHWQREWPSLHQHHELQTTQICTHWVQQSWFHVPQDGGCLWVCPYCCILFSLVKYNGDYMLWTSTFRWSGSCKTSLLHITSVLTWTPPQWKLWLAGNTFVFPHWLDIYIKLFQPKYLPWPRNPIPASELWIECARNHYGTRL